MMGVPIDGPSWMLGDNQSVITSSTIPESSRNKHHNALSYHLVCDCIAAEILYFIHVEGRTNPSELFTKILGWADFWPLIQPLLFWKGETVIPDKPLPVIIKEIKDKLKDKDKGPTPALRGVSDGVNPAVGPVNIHKTSWACTTGPYIIEQ
jgi:hypothetical protein